MSYLLRCSSGVQFRGGGVTFVRANFFLFFLREIFFFIFFVLFHSSLGWIGRGKIFFEIFFFRAKFLFFFFFFLRARVRVGVTPRGVTLGGGPR